MGGGRGRVGDVERPTLAAGGLMLETFSLSFGRAAGTVGGSRAAEGLGSRSRSRTGFGAVAGAGPGDAVLEEAPVGGLVVVSVLFRFSNLAKSEDTGLRDEPSGPSCGGGSMAMTSRVENSSCWIVLQRLHAPLTLSQGAPVVIRCRTSGGDSRVETSTALSHGK
jgi:hypothetical protein